MSEQKNVEPLTAISPLDGRYAAQTAELRDIFSECALIRNRIAVEIAWLKALCAAPDIPEAAPISDRDAAFLDAVTDTFDVTEARAVKEIEKTTNHDVKAVEMYLRNRLIGSSLEKSIEFIHFACTSEDINNIAHALMIKQGRDVLLRLQRDIIDKLSALAEGFAGDAMLGRTHGQPASPTTMGKELAVFAARFERQTQDLEDVTLLAKMNGAVGNYNAHALAYPDVDWPELSRRVIESLGLTQNPLTVQIEPHDYMAELFDVIKRWNTILIDMDRDVWSYISIGYFKQKTKKGEVGSSTMPHKVNPIDFENSEGNAGLAIAVLEHLAVKLPISRLQRDLTDSTACRNIGVAFGYALLAAKSALKGLNKLEIDRDRLAQDIDANPQVLAEAVQTLMRKAGMDNPYDRLKELTRGREITLEGIRAFVDGLELPEADKQRLRSLTPATYIGIADRLARIHS